MIDEGLVREKLDGFRRFLVSKSTDTPVRTSKEGPSLSIADYVAKKLRIRMRDADLRALLELAEAQNFNTFLQIYHGQDPTDLAERDRFEAEFNKLCEVAGYRLNIYKNDRSGMYVLNLR